MENKIRIVQVSGEKSPCLPKEEALKTGGTYRIGIYAIRRNEAGELLSYRRISSLDSNSDETIIYAYSRCVSGSHYVDTLSKEAIDCFEVNSNYTGSNYGFEANDAMDQAVEYQNKRNIPI